MTDKQKQSAKVYSELREKIEKCNTEEELEEVSDLADEYLFFRIISKGAYKEIEEVLDDRLMTLVEEGKV